MMKQEKIKLSAFLIGFSINLYAGQATALNLYSTDTLSLNLDIEATLGAFSSSESYSPNIAASRHPHWQEASIKYGISGDYTPNDRQHLYSKLNFVSSANWGDGDASGATTGKERDTGIEEAYIGYKSDGFSISAGRQIIKIGDGFILNDDGLNLGDGFDPALQRAGAYYTAPHKAFDKSLMVGLDDDSGLHTDIFWFESDNKAQGRPTMAGINVEHNSDLGTFGLLYLKGLDTDPTGLAGGLFDNLQRDGQHTTSVRYQGDAGVKNLFLSAEIANQKQGNSTPDANAWYAEAGWTFSDVNWSPTLKYRYSSFEYGYDQLFTGFNVERDYGTWFQGEIRADYAAGGPFNSDVDVHMLGLTAMPRDDLSLGALFFDFSNTINGTGINDAKELNLYATWFANENLIISPLLGFYKPSHSSSIQGNNNTNTYAQIQAIVLF